MPQERRLVTILFADIVDSSASVRTHDPEVIREALGAIFARAREILVAHGATVEKFIGDAVMAVFGVPVAHEDDPERAVRAAIGLRSAVSAPGSEALRFTFRIGIDSGEVVTGDGSGGELLATGTPVVVAARLEQAAAPGEILVGPLIRELTRRSVEYGEARAVVAKGMGVVQASAVVGTVPEGPQETPRGLFVGRASELQLLTGFLSRASGTARAHLVTILGDPGVGKSRLIGELLRRTGTRYARSTCLPYGRAITYWPIQEILRADAGIAPTDDLATAHAKVEAAVASIDADAAEIADVTRQLSALAVAGRGDGVDTALSMAPRELARPIRRYIEGRVRGSPAILVIEDLHWAEDALLALLDELLAQMRAPVLVVCAGRPELADRGARWGAGRANALTIGLEPLGEIDSERLAAELLGHERDARIPSIVARTEGNPLFIEEYVRALADQGSQDIPASLHGVIAARLDAAPAALRRVLQQASVLGREFWIDALPAELEREELAAQVEEGFRRDLIARSVRTGPSGTRTYRFKHALIRDVAYASLSKAERSRLHDHYALWLATSPGERAPDYAEIALYHAERAFELARDVDAKSWPALGRRAFDSLRWTAELASGRADFPLMLENCRRALVLADLIGLDGRDRAEVQGLAAIARLRLESSEEAIAELDRAIDAAKLLEPTMLLVRLLTWRASSNAIVDDIVGARALYAEAVAVARRTGDADAISYALAKSSEPLRLIGQLREHRRHLEDALAHMRATGSDRWVAHCLVELSATSLEMGETEDARARGEEALAIAEKAGRRLDRYLALEAVARALLAAGDPRAREVAQKTLALARELGGPAPLAAVADVAAEAMERSGDGASAEALVVEVLGTLDPVRTPTLRADIARLEAIHARLALARDDLGAATEAADAAKRVAPRSNVAARVRALMAAARVSEATGRAEEAEGLLSEADAILAPTDHRALKSALEGLKRRAVPGAR